MSPAQIADALQAHNEWRCGSDTPGPVGMQLTEALREAVQILRLLGDAAVVTVADLKSVEETQ